MKYLKKFEAIVSDNTFEEYDDEPVFHEDDYVKLTELDPDDDDALGFKYPYGIIIDSNYHPDDGWEYWIGYFNEDDEFVQQCVSGTFYIERLLTDEEIEEFKIKQKADKYNL